VKEGGCITLYAYEAAECVGSVRVGHDSFDMQVFVVLFEYVYMASGKSISARRHER
jgi:hypothetical protein